MPFAKGSTRTGLEVTLKGMGFTFVAKVRGDIDFPWAVLGSGFAFTGIVFSKAVLHVAA